ncbi:MAG: ergothioneine biosynthesis protein EgtB [Burkholderiaceae bacterium]|nr:ergothioneine biosynthesis protein EgtB [Burkholderiaceae bacterium]
MPTPSLHTRNTTRSSLPSSGASTSLMDTFYRLRETTMRLAAQLSPEDCQVQSMPDASPVKWHLAHTTWFFETFILSVFQSDYQAFSSDFKVLFNSYYNAIGDKHPRPARGLLTRPALSEVMNYRRHVDKAMMALMKSLASTAQLACSSDTTLRDKATDGTTSGAVPMDPSPDEFVRMVILGLHHEQQHQELILTDVKHMLGCNPLFPAYASPDNATISAASSDTGWTPFEGGIYRIGHDGDGFGFGFAFDNESPAHEILLQPYALANRLVTQGEYLKFVEAGGYIKPTFWLSAGWDAVNENGWRAPMYWCCRDGVWQHFTLHGLRPLDLAAPVAHISYFEADAYARWTGARLPREAEWECAARSLGVGAMRDGNFLEDGHLAPTGAAEGVQGLAQMFGDVWEWTCSSYDAYPGFAPPAGAVGEYNGKFMCNQYVLRGGSCATPRSHIRPSYRNFFPTHARWQFTGLRLARGV